MKKIILMLVVSAIMVLGLAACGSGSESDGSGASQEMIKVFVSIDFPDDSDLEDVKSEQIEVADGTALLDVMTDNYDVETVSHSGGEGVGSINGVAEDGSAGWLYTINDEIVMEYPDACKVKDGDAIQWTYSSM